MVKFLHVSDLHLGMRITRFEEGACGRIGEARFEAIEKLRAAASEHRVDFILIAGDVFDDHSVSRTVAERAFTLFEGRAITCPVFVIPGNHDPLSPGGVWDRPPWDRELPKHLRVLREPSPVRVPDLPVTLFPCPLRARNSIHDPTAWIAGHPRGPGDRSIRVGLAHGSLNFLPELPLDDHLIRPDAADALGLDYLALGHWHGALTYPSPRDKVARTAYSGTHEPMRFPGRGAGDSTGWSSYSGDGDADRFRDAGRGTALLVSVDEAGAPPEIETIEVGRLRWLSEEHDLTSQRFGALITRYAEREDRELTLLRLRLTGVVDPHTYERINNEFRTIISNRYYPGTVVDADDVLVEQGDPGRLKALVGDGVVSRVLDRLRDESRSPDPATRRVAELAIKLLYRIASEGQPS